MAKSSDTLLVLIIGAVIVFAIVSPALLAGGASLVDALGQFVREGFGDVTNGDVDLTGGTSGSAHVGLTIHYADGSERTFEPSNPLSLLPLSISDEYGEIAWLEPELSATMEFEGTISSWSVTATLDAHIREKMNTMIAIYSFKYWDISATGSSWETATQRIVTKQIIAPDIETALVSNGYGSGSYTLRMVASLEITVNFEDGTSDTATASGVQTEWDFTYDTVESSIKSLQVHVFVGKVRV